MKALMLFAALVTLSGCALAPREDWRPRDTALEVSFQVMNAADAATTLRFRRIGGREDGNVARAIMGPYPDRGEVLTYFATRGLSHYLISRVLPPKWRQWWNPWWTLESAAAVNNNCHIKIREPDGSLKDAGIC